MLAVKSARVHHPDAEVVLWHERGLSVDARVSSLNAAGVRLEVIDFEGLIESARANSNSNGRSRWDAMLRLWSELGAPAARSNVVRLLILYNEGGIYLDTDTLTLRPLTELRRDPGFCGLEHILWSKQRLKKTRPYFWTLGPALSAIRWACGHAERGYALVRPQLRFYDQAANNAVLGFVAGHPLLDRAFARMATLDPSESTRRYRLGTHLLQELLATAAADGLATRRYPPSYFYPLGPVVSRHYFYDRADVASVTAKLIPSDAHVLHWYASVADLKRLDEQYIASHRHKSVYAHLCAPLLG